MKQFEAAAKTVEEAIEQGLQELGVSIGDVDVMVVEEGSKGLFGLFGSRPAKVRLTVKAAEEDPLGPKRRTGSPQPRARRLPSRKRRRSPRKRSLRRSRKMKRPKKLPQQARKR